jgi:hypothetical protein
VAALGDLDALPADSMPEMSLRGCGVTPINFGAAMNLSLEEAYAEVFPFFGGLRKKGKPVQQYDTINGLVDGLLGQNYKTAKETPEQPSDVQGLSLLPEARATEFERGLGMKTLCAGSSPACRAACLVYAGHNESDIYNGLVKFARTKAFLKRPSHFMRLVAESIERRKHRKYYYIDETTRKHVPDRDHELFVRMNVFSDVPWELVAPGFFERFSDVQFYDYTKVPHRRLPRNYDMTFSYSGANEEYVSHELRRGSRIAIVFLPPKGLQRMTAFPSPRQPEKRPDGYGLPSTIRGLRVVDGDDERERAEYVANNDDLQVDHLTVGATLPIGTAPDVMVALDSYWYLNGDQTAKDMLDQWFDELGVRS